VDGEKKKKKAVGENIRPPTSVGVTMAVDNRIRPLSKLRKD